MHLGEIGQVGGTLGLLGATTFASAMAAQSFADERRVGTLDLLLATTLPTWRIVLAKSAAVVCRLAPLLGILALLLAAAWGRDEYRYSPHGYPNPQMFPHAHPPWGPNLPGGTLVRLVPIGAWVVALVGAWAVFGAWLGARVRPPAAAMPLAAVAPFLATAGGIYLLSTTRRSPEHSIVATIAFPLLSGALTCQFGGVPRALVFSTALWGAVASLLAVVVALRLRAWVAAERAG
jgi:ABC-type Na+ efflux pump permease subunit